MSGQMSLESAHLCEGLAAYIALKRPFARVNPHVLLQIAFGTEGFIASVAHVLLLLARR